MNPFTGMVSQLATAGCTVHSMAFQSGPQQLNRTELMRRYLMNRPATAATLSEVAGLGDSARVMALLKADINKGQIERRGRLYYWVHSYDDDVRKAILLLTRNGYTVTKAKGDDE